MTAQFHIEGTTGSQERVDAHNTFGSAHADIRGMITAAIAGVPEQARDALGSALVAGANVTITPNDGADTITISASSGSSYTDENAQDAAAALFSNGTQTGINVVYDDASNSISLTVPAGYTDEQAQEAVASLLGSGTHTGITFTYDDPDNAMSAAVVPGAGDLPEFATSAQTSAVGTPANMVGKVTRYDTIGGAISQPLPAATAGAVFAVGWDAGTAALTLNRAGSDVIGSGSATSAVVPLVGEVITYHCTTTGRWRVVGGFKTQASLDAKTNNRALILASYIGV